eukprot:203626_1
MRSASIQILGATPENVECTDDPPHVPHDETTVKKALLVDDLKVTNKCTARSLFQAGYECHTADDGQKAVDMARKTHYDIIVMDVQLPVLNGVEATRKIRMNEKLRERQGSLPVKSNIIGLTGSCDAEDLTSYAEAGMIACIEKGSVISRAVHEILAVRRQRPQEFVFINSENVVWELPDCVEAGLERLRIGEASSISSSGSTTPVSPLTPTASATPANPTPPPAANAPSRRLSSHLSDTTGKPQQPRLSTRRRMSGPKGTQLFPGFLPGANPDPDMTGGKRLSYRPPAVSKLLQRVSGGGPDGVDGDIDGIPSFVPASLKLRHHVPGNILRRQQMMKQMTPAHHKEVNCLLVDDVKVTQKVTIRALKRSGYQCDVAGDGKVALSMAKIHKYHVIMMDVQLPEMDGIEATKLIREHERTTGHKALIFGLTASCEPDDLNSYAECGMDGCVEKGCLLSSALHEAIATLTENPANFIFIDRRNVHSLPIEEEKWKQAT